MRPLRWYWFDFVAWRRRTAEKIWMGLAWHCVPKMLRYWITVRACCAATRSDQHPEDVNTIDVLRSFEPVR